MKRYLVLGYGALAYLLFFVTFAYWFVFLSGLGPGPTVNGPALTPWPIALLIDLGLIALFGLQHSVMARPAFKAKLARYLPSVLERSTYVLFSSLALAIVYVGWQPINLDIWIVDSAMGRGILYGLFASGFLTIFFSSLFINHFDLFGLRHVWLYFQGKSYTPLKFGTPGPYRWIRHPLYLGWFLSLWATPQLSVGHLIYAAGFTLYIIIAVKHEERDLVAEHGVHYERYQRQVPRYFPRLQLRSLIIRHRQLRTISRN